ncbi:alpha-L-rhamnosidase C-terminal domain-containing protein, partial [Frankia sp. CcI49]
LYRTALIAADAAAHLDLKADEQRWRKLAERTRSAFQARYVVEGTRITSDAQAVYALAIHFGLLDDVQKAEAGERLACLIAEGGYRVGTGFAGTPFVVWALTETGNAEVAYRLLLQEEPPSWLYMVAMGATTIWERWDSLLPDGTVNSGEMTSFNHYALGAVVDWLYKCVAGIRPAQPGYARLHLAPIPGPGLDWARGQVETRRGRVECGWTRHSDGVITIECVVPDGVEADLYLPDGTTRLLTSGSHRIRTEKGA